MVLNQYVCCITLSFLSETASDSEEVSAETRQKDEGIFLNVHMVLKAILASVPM
jgi:hypothetical protein